MKSLLLAAILVLHGVVLQVEPHDRAFVHHDAFGGMPAMTMEFSLPHGTVVHPGDRVEVDGFGNIHIHVGAGGAI